MVITDETKKFIYGVATLSGTIVGVGFFALPYITSQVGIWIMLAYFIVLGGIVIFIHYIFGEVALKTPDFLRLPGYAEIYLGKKGRKIALISTILGIYGTILAYLIVGGKFLENLVSPLIGGNYLFYTLLYFALGALLIYFGIKPIAKISFFAMVIFLFILALFFFYGRPFLRVENLFRQPDLGKLFLPYGPLLFSLWGATMIPEIEEMLGERKELLKKVIIVSVLIAIILYLLFILAVASVSGQKTTVDAVSGLRSFLGERVVGLGLLMGILTTFTSFLALGLTLEKIFRYELKVPKNFAFFLVCFVPLILFLMGVNNFLGVISFIGGVMIGVEGTLIVLIYYKLSRKKLVAYPLILIFFGGVIYEIAKFLR